MVQLDTIREKETERGTASFYTFYFHFSNRIWSYSINLFSVKVPPPGEIFFFWWGLQICIHKVISFGS